MFSAPFLVCASALVLLQSLLFAGTEAVTFDPLRGYVGSVGNNIVIQSPVNGSVLVGGYDLFKVQAYCLTAFGILR